MGNNCIVLDKSFSAHAFQTSCCWSMHLINLDASPFFRGFWHLIVAYQILLYMCLTSVGIRQFSLKTEEFFFKFNG